MAWETPAVITFANRRELRRSYWHELGHVFDMQVLAPSGLRPAFAAIDGRPWTTPASEERFAQAYALCAHNKILRRPYKSEYHAFSLTPRQFLRVCRLIRGAVQSG